MANNLSSAHPIAAAGSAPLLRSLSSITVVDTDSGEQFPGPEWTAQRIEDFSWQLCQLMVVSNIAWRAADQPYWRLFFQNWIPGVVLPGRNELSGRILDAEAQKCIANIANTVRGRLATGQCDGWKDIKRSSIIAVMMNVEYTVNDRLICFRSAHNFTATSD